jgi:hypothetical protein
MKKANAISKSAISDIVTEKVIFVLLEPHCIYIKRKLLTTRGV